MKIRYSININGIIQGVGFRPFIHKLANKFNINGWVRNTNQGIEMEIEGEKYFCVSFLSELKHNPPPLTLIENISIKELPVIGFTEFVIRNSNSADRPPIILMPPDISICNDCLKELNNPSDLRYRYPFINCTNCGPRFSIIQDMPYDRNKTTMDKFVMCSNCLDEYNNLGSRRYHAEANTCPICGPHVYLYVKNQKIDVDDPIKEAQDRLKRGEVGLIKGLGGFHLTCNAKDIQAVSRIREIKKRDQKPLALMTESLSEIKEICYIPELARKYLESRERPIVLLKKKNTATLSPQLAPDNGYLGFMLPYTPLHYMLIQKSHLILVMTSANFSDEPIIIENETAIREFAQSVDFLLLHNRSIYNRCDDSVLKIAEQNIIFIRRSRGYSPYPIILSKKTKSILALGPEEKNTICLMRDSYAIPSQHLGDLKNKDNFIAYQEAIERITKIFKFVPEIVACDLHPNYLSTHFAEIFSQKRHIPLTRVQHHHAHIVSCMVENNVYERVIGVAFDGTGFGSDGTIWGGEFLIASPDEYFRAGHLKYVRMPGGEQAIREPWRMAFSYLHSLHNQKEDKKYSILKIRQDKENLQLLQQMIEKGINSPLTSSCGRLFDAIASLIGLKDIVDFEGQAAMEMESLCKEEYRNNYNYRISKETDRWIIDSEEMISQILNDLKKRVSLNQISTQFHNTIADFTLSLCVKIRGEYNINYVALSGGVFQNSFLLLQTIKKLKKEGFSILIHKKLPPNDACISLGQAFVASELNP